MKAHESLAACSKQRRFRLKTSDTRFRISIIQNRPEILYSIQNQTMTKQNMIEWAESAAQSNGWEIRAMTSTHGFERNQ